MSMKVCLSCEGTGIKRVPLYYSHAEGQVYKPTHCPDCGGTGRIVPMKEG